MDGVFGGVDRTPSQGNATARHSVLFLQGPISDFFDRLGRALIARGHRVHRINLHLGDQLFWRLPAVNFRGRFEEWRGFVGEFLDRNAITEVIVHGDRRPHHIVAAEEARARGIVVMATDLGYVRPDWVTLEYDGMSSYSRLPRDPAAIRDLAACLPALEAKPRFPSVSFAWSAVLDVIYNVAQVLGRPLYPHYRWHGIFHPYTEYAGWIMTLTRYQVTRRATIAAKVGLEAEPKSYFLFPLQLATDFQVRAHSPFVDARDAVRRVIASFAASGSSRKLVLVVHPLDNGLVGWRGLAANAARRFGVADRVTVLRDGTPIEVLRRAAGVITINSTVGLTAVSEGVPVKVLGNAVFDIPGLSYQDDLDQFWNDPTPPDPDMREAFLRAVIGTTQVRGGYYERASKAEAITGFIERIEHGLFPLPPLSAADLAERKIRDSSSGVAIIGAGGGIGRALARDYAGPGVSLFLAGDGLEMVAEDCRRRGAIVETCTERSELDRALSAFDRRTPIDVLIAPAETGPIAATAALMRRRGHGRIVLAPAHDRRHGLADPIVSRAVADPEVERLRRQLQGSGIALTLVRPGWLASWLAARCGESRLLEVGDDRAARLIRTGLARGADVIALPGSVVVARRGLSLLPAAIRGWAGKTFAPRAPTAAPEADDAPLHSETGAGN